MKKSRKHHFLWMEFQMKYKKYFWMDKTKLSEIPTFEYWNNKDIELEKIWSIPNDDFGLLEKKFFPQRFISTIQIYILEQGLIQYKYLKFNVREKIN